MVPEDVQYRGADALCASLCMWCGLLHSLADTGSMECGHSDSVTLFAPRTPHGHASLKRRVFEDQRSVRINGHAVTLEGERNGH